MVAIEGVDYAFPPIPSPGALKAAGKRFACRYLGPGSDSKHLTSAELSALRNAGIDVVANAEGAANGFRGQTAGKSWATSALADARALGMPNGRPIYFSVDWPAGPDDWPDIDAALKGAASVIGAAQVGVYGSYDVIQHCKTAGTARWFWQTYAWSQGRQHPAAHLYQYRNTQRIDGCDCDFTRALQLDFGQWGGVMATLDDTDLKNLSQAVASKLYNDLKDDNSGLSQQLDRHLQGLLDDTRNFTGKPGERLTALGWAAGSPWDLLQRLFELVATAPKMETSDDGTTINLPGGVLPRLDRIEDAVTAQRQSEQPSA
jgi:hypothetical protein